MTRKRRSSPMAMTGVKAVAGDGKKPTDQQQPLATPNNAAGMHRGSSRPDREGHRHRAGQDVECSG